MHEHIVKRAAVNWGIGRELYTSPFVWVNVPTQKRQNGKYELTDSSVFNGARVTEIEYDKKRRISTLVITDKDGAVMYSYPRKRMSKALKKDLADTEAKNEAVPAGTITTEDAKRLKDALEATNSDTAKFLDFVSRVIGHRVANVDGMTYDEFDIAIKAINKKMERS